mmetsp:Transcript_27878/g.52037  ORF Transcript_27878/g.52037 Transcript_27878/m.52037 type:complete len:119 (+) Transcript_27878:165-521(+)
MHDGDHEDDGDDKDDDDDDDDDDGAAVGAMSAPGQLPPPSPPSSGVSETMPMSLLQRLPHTNPPAHVSTATTRSPAQKRRSASAAVIVLPSPLRTLVLKKYFVCKEQWSWQAGEKRER